VAQERQRLINKFGPSPFSDKADLQVLLDQFRESEARQAQARGSLFYTTGGNSRYVDNDESIDAGPTNVSVDHSISYARKAIKEITEIGKMRLEERKSSEKTENDVVQESDVSSTTSSSTDKDDTAETHRPDSADFAAENTPPSVEEPASPPCSSGEVSSSSQDHNMQRNAATH